VPRGAAVTPLHAAGQRTVAAVDGTRAGGVAVLGASAPAPIDGAVTGAPGGVVGSVCALDSGRVIVGMGNPGPVGVGAAVDRVGVGRAVGTGVEGPLCTVTGPPGWM
jgi:hypothetical protein